MNKPIKILIADDHQLFIDGIKALLHEFKDLEIISQANDGEEVINRLKTSLPDIILMDIGMAGKNGIETTEQLVKQYPSVKVIALTMYDDQARIGKMLKAGVKGYLLKNTTREELYQAIHTVAGGQSFYSKQVVDTVMKQSYAPESNPVLLLTKRELEVIKLVVKSMTSKEIADALSISELTVNTHRKNAMQKLEVKNIAGLVKFAMDHNLAAL